MDIQKISLIGDVQLCDMAREQEEQQADRSAEDGAITVFAFAGLADTLVVHLAKMDAHVQGDSIRQTDSKELRKILKALRR